MSTTSQHLGLKIPDGSDPFLRTDFVNNYDILDAYPGAWICTSSTRPNWGANQSGMVIIETDTRRVMQWSGGAFHELLTGPAIWWGSVRPNVMVGQGTSTTFVVGSFTVNRPGTLLAITTTELDLPSNGYIEGNVRAMLDGSPANWDGTSYGEYYKMNWSNSATTNGQNNFAATITSLGVRNISAGTHSVGFQVTVHDYSTINTQVQITSCRALAMFVNGTDR